MKDKHLLLIAFGLLALINLTCLWEQLYFPLVMGLFIFEVLAFIVFVLLWMAQVYMVIREKPKQRSPYITLFICFLVIALAVRFPSGITFSSPAESNAWMLAGHEGSANCTIHLALLPGDEFRQEEICFGTYSQRGSYRLRQDTVYLEYRGNSERQRFTHGVFRHLPTDTAPTLLELFLQPPDTLSVFMKVTRYRKH